MRAGVVVFCSCCFWRRDGLGGNEGEGGECLRSISSMRDCLMPGGRLSVSVASCEWWTVNMDIVDYV
jgi:hypothetical protein